MSDEPTIVLRDRDERTALLDLIGISIAEDVKTYNIDYRRRLMRVRHNGREFWFEMKEGEPPDV